MASPSALIDRIVDLPPPGPDGGPALSVIDESGHQADLPLGLLAQGAMRLCAALGTLGIAPGELVLLALPISLPSVELFLGCVLRGVLPCMLAAVDRRAAASTAETACVVARHYLPRAVVVPAVAAGAFRARLADPRVQVLGLDQLQAAAAAGGAPVLCRAVENHPHHVQLTSGSLARPKAALITHGNVAASIAAMTRRVAYDPGRGDNAVSWLPLHHDMGLMTLLCNLHARGSLLQMQPSGFIRHPLGWLAQLSRRRATTTAVPTFALRYCVSRFQAERLEGVDLRTCRSVCVGAERVDAPSLRAFARAFAPYGLAASALQPCYGMAESTLAVTMHPATEPPVPDSLAHWHGDTIDARLAAARRIAQPPARTAAPHGAGPGAGSPSERRPTQVVVSVGQPVPGMACEIRRRDGSVAAERHIGEVFIRGSSLMQGYLPPRRASAVAAGAVPRPADFDPNGWFATGDIGYLAAGHLYILGRSKEVIILRGANRCPEDFERAVAGHPAVCHGACAAVGVHDEREGTERLVLLVEARPADMHAGHRLELQACLREACGHAAHDIVFVAPGSLPRTSSGKLQRPRCRELYLALGAAPSHPAAGGLDGARPPGPAGVHP